MAIRSYIGAIDRDNRTRHLCSAIFREPQCEISHGSWLTHLDGSAAGIDLRFAGVSIVPGKIRFAVSPASLFSSATVRTSVASADLNVTYAPRPACGSTAVKLPIATMRPFPDFRRLGIAARST